MSADMPKSFLIKNLTIKLNSLKEDEDVNERPVGKSRILKFTILNFFKV